MAARVDRAVRKELNFEFEQAIFWTDSMITLNYIRSESRRFQTYVSNRVGEIRDLTNADQWKHCSGKRNRANDVSRGLEINEFLKNEHWLKGPSFLREERKGKGCREAMGSHLCMYQLSLCTPGSRQVTGKG